MPPSKLPVPTRRTTTLTKATTTQPPSQPKPKREPSQRTGGGGVHAHVQRLRAEASAKDASNRREIKAYIWGDKPQDSKPQTQDDIVGRVYEILKSEGSDVLKYFGGGQGGLANMPKDMKREFERLIGVQFRKKSCAVPPTTTAASATAATRGGGGGGSRGRGRT